jgi:hypothetical protein
MRAKGRNHLLQDVGVIGVDQESVDHLARSVRRRARFQREKHFAVVGAPSALCAIARGVALASGARHVARADRFIVRLKRRDGRAGVLETYCATAAYLNDIGCGARGIGGVRVGSCTELDGEKKDKRRAGQAKTMRPIYGAKA